MTIKFPKRLHDEEDFIRQEKANNLFYSKKKKLYGITRNYLLCNIPLSYLIWSINKDCLYKLKRTWASKQRIDEI